MPKGIGTYGSKVGRPPKKQEYQQGGEVEPNFPMENPAIKEANEMGQELNTISLDSIEPEFPAVNAMERSEVYREGGIVEKQKIEEVYEKKLVDEGQKISREEAKKRKEKLLKEFKYGKPKKKKDDWIINKGRA